MPTWLMCLLSAVAGALVGGPTVYRYLMDRCAVDTTTHATYPPKLTLIERQDRTGTDQYPPLNGRGW